MSAHTKGPTLEQLHAVWLKRKRGPLWPASFEEAMEHPLLSRILKIRALHIEVRTIISREGPQPPMPEPRRTHPEPDRRAYWMDSQDPEDESET